MPELSQTRSASRSAYLELLHELELTNDGYRFLDEKRILLAAEILQQRDVYRDAHDRFKALCRSAADALREAAADQGLDGLQVAPVPVLTNPRLQVAGRACVGLELLDATFDPGNVAMRRGPLRPSPGLDTCREAYLDVVKAAAPLAALTANLQRLMHEYARTERRVRALENVVLPEIKGEIEAMEEHLDLVDQEEVIRVLTFRHEREQAQPDSLRTR
jgi:V/A-type H+-transporting ATPase subunit D